ncbi:MAG: hypothetical protein U0232_15815 [Thermomicrobiales bacterium]
MGAGEAAIAALCRAARGIGLSATGDSCSGWRALHERTFAAVNGWWRGFGQCPSLFAFPVTRLSGWWRWGELRRQWAHWFEREMAWYDRAIPLYHTTGNHTTFDAVSEAVFGRCWGICRATALRGRRG